MLATKLCVPAGSWKLEAYSHCKKLISDMLKNALYLYKQIQACMQTCILSHLNIFLFANSLFVCLYVSVCLTFFLSLFFFPLFLPPCLYVCMSVCLSISLFFSFCLCLLAFTTFFLRRELPLLYDFMIWPLCLDCINMTKKFPSSTMWRSQILSWWFSR